MKIGTAFPSKYLKATDLPDGQFIGVTIREVILENVAGNGQPEEDKPVLYFQGKDKGIVLNRTNSQAISDVYGDETEEWAGKRIQLYATTTLFQGKTTACIRVNVPKAQARHPGAAAAPARQTVPPQQQEYQGESSGQIDPSDIPF